MGKIRVIEAKDNKVIESIIRTCLIEFGADHEGTAWADPDLGRFFEIYQETGTRYWVAEDESGKIVAGVGIGKLAGTDSVCELQKMYCMKEARGSGIAHQLIQEALSFAGQYYQECYLETLENMKAARRFYHKYGFKRVDQPFAETGHFACDVRMIRSL
ncbi:histone acetyltransferase HPA2 [Lachnospiraceae bacterium KM106-2]|nr:histone acetyltransferase HPA2 [Lachnospiraceae bacterium KM106-2]